MKRKIIISLLILFLISASGAMIAILNIATTTETLSRLINLHQIEDLRKHLIISIQTVQSDLYTVRTTLGQNVDAIIDNVSNLESAAARCSSCHHTAEITRRIEHVQDLIGDYQEALSYYITASANRRRVDQIKLEAAGIGNELLETTGAMSMQAGRKLEALTSAAMARIRTARLILFVTTGVTFALGIVVAVRLTRSITRPVQALVEATRAISAGDLGHAVSIADRTEFGELADRFNEMSTALRENYASLEREIADRWQVEEALRESEERYALAERGANDGLWDWNIRSNTIFYASRWKSMLGYEEDGIGNALREWMDRVHPADRDQLESRIATHLSGQNKHFECEYRIRHRDGSYRWVLCRGLAVRDKDGKPSRMAGSQTDITARKSAEEQLIHDAFHDTLTALPNRALFMDRLDHVIASARRHPSYLYAVLFLDLDRFKVVNDSLGHTVGDRLLIEVGRRLKSCLRPGDTVARLGGDEFAVLLENISSASDAEEVTQRIEKSMAAPFSIQGQDIYTTQSIGIAIKSERYEWPEQILRDADIAMYEAKANGRSRHEYFDAAMHASIIDRIQLEADLRVAVERHDGFVLHYQPIMDLQDHRLTGFEALIRWNHASRGVIYPLEFIPLAEETGMIVPLSAWILRESCRQLKQWQTKFPSTPPLTMSVNVSGRVLLQPGFAEAVGELLREESPETGTLAIEVTESMIMEQTDIVVETMTRLQELGVHIHIDDFGTGYSSLSYLHNFPVDALKIDRSFIAKMSTASDNQEIVRTIVALAQNLNLKVIAEGVELNHQLAAVSGLACQYGQGFIFSKPLPAETLETWIGSARKSGS